MDDALVEKVAREICSALIEYAGPRDRTFTEQIDEEWWEYTDAARAVLALSDIRLAGVKEGLEMARAKANEAVTKMQTRAIDEQRAYYTPNEAGAVDLGCRLIADIDVAIRSLGPRP